MASGIDPEAKPAKPAAAAPKPAAAPAKPAAAAQPAKPAAPPAKPVAAQPAKPAAAQQEALPEEPARSAARGLLKTTPAWAISMLVHIVALLAMALVVTPTPEKEKPRLITSSAPEADENFEEFEEQEPVEQTDLPTVTDVAVPTDVTVVEDVKVVANADDLDAAPVAVEFTEFGSETAPATDMLATVGAIGGAGGGFGGRKAGKTGQIAAANGGGADTEAAVEAALKWFINHQMPDGGWSFDLQACPSCNGQCKHGGDGADRCAATAMALLPFLGKGYTHREGPYQPQIERGVAFLAGMAMQGRGKVYGKGSMYSQGLAGIVLSESFGMTQDQRLAVPAQLALNFIMDAQDPVGGGWRYTPRQPGDTSAVGWQLMALKSGHMAYLQVNPLTIKKAVEFLDSVQTPDGSGYGYSDPGDRPGTSAVGLLCRMYLGWKKDHPGLQAGAARMAKRGPTGDLYTDYYSTQVMHHMEGDMWLSWNGKMKPMLLKAQAKSGHEAGSFFEGLDKGHGAHRAGRLYCTSLATMILEVYYRHLPIYRNQSVNEEFRE
jgi:hypothetical protein